MGAQLVFQHGVGVEKVIGLEEALEEQKVELERSRGQFSGPSVADDGSWTWIPGVHAAEALRETFVFIEGDAGQLDMVADNDSALVFTVQGAHVLFVFDQPMGSVQIDMMLGVQAFDGLVQVVHHVQDAQNYHFVELAAGTMQQGRMADGKSENMDEQPFTGEEWQKLRIVADKTHFRAYAGSVLVTHGHGPAPQEGSVGLLLEGSGTVRLGRMAVQSLR